MTRPLEPGVASYRENGFLVVENLLDSEELGRLREDAVKICRGEYPSEKLKPADSCLTDEEALQQYLCIHQPHIISPVIRQALGLQSIVEILTRLIGPDVKCMQSMLFIKPPGFPGQAWHQDEVYIPTRDRSLTGAWYALDDATVDNGCLWVLPGSHRTGYLYPQREHGNPAEFDFAHESYGFSDAEEVPVECPAGSVVFFHGYLLHRSRKNRSKGYRRVLVNHYMNAYSLLPWHAKTEEGAGAAQADYRGIVMVAGEDPYAWKGIETPKHGVHVREFDPKALRGEDDASSLEKPTT